MPCRLVFPVALLLACAPPASSFEAPSQTAPPKTASSPANDKPVISSGALPDATVAGRLAIDHGDASGLSVRATGAPFFRQNADRAADPVSIKHFGAIGDGNRHPLKERYPSLAAARSDCPKATALTDEIDWCALQTAADKAVPIDLGNGRYWVNRTVEVSTDNAMFRGVDRGLTKIYRTGDFGPTFYFGTRSPAAVHYSGLMNVDLSDAGSGPGAVMTQARSPFHVVLENHNRTIIENVVVYSGAEGSAGGGIETLAGIDWLVRNVLIGLYTGPSVGRVGFMVGSTKIVGVRAPNGGGFNQVDGMDVSCGGTNFDRSGKALSLRAYVEDSILIDGGDGLWMRNVHTNFSTRSGVHIQTHDTRPILNTTMTEMMLDSASGHGLLIDGPGLAHRLHFSGWITDAALGEAGFDGVHATARLSSVTLDLKSVDGMGRWCVYHDNPASERVTINLGDLYNCQVKGTGAGALNIQSGSYFAVNGGIIGSNDRVMDFGWVIGAGARNVTVTGLNTSRVTYSGVIQSGADRIAISGGSVAGGISDQTPPSAAIRVNGVIGASDVTKPRS